MATSRRGGQPEALATFAAAERNGGKKPDDVGLKATPDTALLDGNLAQEQEAANRVLREGVTATDKHADEAVKELPDRVMAHRGTAKVS